MEWATGGGLNLAVAGEMRTRRVQNVSICASVNQVDAYSDAKGSIGHAFQLMRAVDQSHL